MIEAPEGGYIVIKGEAVGTVGFRKISRQPSFSRRATPMEKLLVVENNIQEGTVYFHFAVIRNEAQLSELI